MLPPIPVLTRRAGRFFGAPAVSAARPLAVVRPLTLSWATASVDEVRAAVPQLFNWVVATQQLQASSRSPGSARLAVYYKGGWYYAAYVVGTYSYLYKSSASSNHGSSPPNWPPLPTTNLATNVSRLAR